MINHDSADSSTQKGSAGGMGQIAGGRESGSTGSFLGPPGRIGMITGAPSPHQVLFVTSFRNKVNWSKVFYHPPENLSLLYQLVSLCLFSCIQALEMCIS